MKLIGCPHCKDLVVLYTRHARSCYCGKVVGKYLSNHLTAVVNKEATVVGIDNNGYGVALQLSERHSDMKDRIDFFFTGWIPNIPGEVIVVESVEMVLGFDYFFEVYEKPNGTRPTESVEKGKKIKNKWKLWWDTFWENGPCGRPIG